MTSLSSKHALLLLWLLFVSTTAAQLLPTLRWDPNTPLPTVPVSLLCGLAGNSCCPPGPGSNGEEFCASGRTVNVECRKVAGQEHGKCFACGTIDKEPCVAVLGGNHCKFPLDQVNGKCVACGGLVQPPCKQLDQYPCNNGCIPHANVVGGVCWPCGDRFMNGCFNQDRAGACTGYQDYFPCKEGHVLKNSRCQECGSEGMWPCVAGCNTGLRVKNQVCSSTCGTNGQQPCDDGQCVAPLVNIGGVCKACGNQGQQPCPATGCNRPYRIRSGVCADCGREGTRPCDSGCDGGVPTEQGRCSSTCGADGRPRCDYGCRAGLVAGEDGICRPSETGPPPGDPRACARDGEHCYVGDSFPGAGPFCCGDRGLLFCKNGICVRGGQ